MFFVVNFITDLTSMMLNTTLTGDHAPFSLSCSVVQSDPSCIHIGLAWIHVVFDTCYAVGVASRAWYKFHEKLQSVASRACSKFQKKLQSVASRACSKFHEKLQSVASRACSKFQEKLQSVASRECSKFQQKLQSVASRACYEFVAPR